MSNMKKERTFIVSDSLSTYLRTLTLVQFHNYSISFVCKYFTTTSIEIACKCHVLPLIAFKLRLSAILDKFNKHTLNYASMFGI
jgi:hypothetical protein